MNDFVYKQIFEDKDWSFEFKLTMACRLAKIICDGHISEVTEKVRWEITKQLQPWKLENRLTINAIQKEIASEGMIGNINLGEVIFIKDFHRVKF